MKFLIPVLCTFLVLVSDAHSKATRIIGGEAARAGQFPWQAAIYLENSSGRYFCGGALVSNQWVLTAGQCVFNVRTFTIHLGSNTLSDEDSERVTLTTSTYVVHPLYNQNTLENDIGLIKFHMPITFTDYIQKINIATTDELVAGLIVYAAGFGQTSDAVAGVNNELHYVPLIVISNVECQLTYGNQIKESMVCAVGVYNQGICIGDTGSPIVYNTDMYGHILAGVASFMSQNGCESYDPSGYSRADVYQEWITNVTSSV